ncbi:hypothetical protein T265_14547, partial [Opisthorchis viverrini]
MEMGSTSGTSPFSSCITQKEKEKEKRKRKSKTTIYRKSTDTGTVLNYSSAHAKSVYASIASSMFSRVGVLCTEEIDRTTSGNRINSEFDQTVTKKDIGSGIKIQNGKTLRSVLVQFKAPLSAESARDCVHENIAMIALGGLRFIPQRLTAEAVEITEHHSANKIEVVELASGQDVPLRSVGPFITDSQLDTECVGSGISPTFYKNLATSTLGEYARIPTDTDNLHAAYTPESVRACYVRMRQVYEAVEQDRIGKATLLKNLHYAIMVMESTYISERRRIREEEEDLSEAATEFVPDEVRDWLASTFTRTQALSGIGNQKPRFRSVANAIRAGIFVE